MTGTVKPLSRDELTSSLRRLGIADGDVVMVHASLRAMGRVEDGAAGVVRALDAAVGPTGTVMMTLGAREGGEPFDCHLTPADPEIGVLAEIFRQTPGTVVSDHPEGRFGARGRLADALLSEVPWDDYYGPGSPLERLVEAQGRVLRLGADRDTVTLIHYAEYLADVPNKRRVVRQPRVRGALARRSGSSTAWTTVRASWTIRARITSRRSSTRSWQRRTARRARSGRRVRNCSMPPRW